MTLTKEPKSLYQYENKRKRRALTYIINRVTRSRRRSKENKKKNGPRLRLNRVTAEFIKLLQLILHLLGNVAADN